MQTAVLQGKENPRGATAVFALDAEAAPDAQAVVTFVESTDQEGNRKKIADQVGGTVGAGGASGRKAELYANLIDLNIMPINLHALMRGVPLANLYNFAYTFDQLIASMYGKQASVLVGNPTDTTTMFLRLLSDPFLEVPWDQYGSETHSMGSGGFVHRMFRGDNGLGMGRPKFLSDQLANKALYISIYQDAADLDEGGPAVGIGRARGSEGGGSPMTRIWAQLSGPMVAEMERLTLTATIVAAGGTVVPAAGLTQRFAAGNRRTPAFEKWLDDAIQLGRDLVALLNSGRATARSYFGRLITRLNGRAPGARFFSRAQVDGMFTMMGRVITPAAGYSWGDGELPRTEDIGRAIRAAVDFDPLGRMNAAIEVARAAGDAAAVARIRGDIATLRGQVEAQRAAAEAQVPALQALTATAQANANANLADPALAATLAQAQAIQALAEGARDNLATLVGNADVVLTAAVPGPAGVVPAPLDGMVAQANLPLSAEWFASMAGVATAVLAGFELVKTSRAPALTAGVVAALNAAIDPLQQPPTAGLINTALDEPSPNLGLMVALITDHGGNVLNPIRILRQERVIRSPIGAVLQAVLSESARTVAPVAYTIATASRQIGPRSAKISYLQATETGAPGERPGTTSRIVEVPVSFNAKMKLETIGKLRFDTRFVRKLMFITNVGRLLRLKLQRELLEERRAVVGSIRTLAPGVTEYGQDPFGADDVYESRTYAGEPRFPSTRSGL
jgi:hypothetical protein